MPQLIITAGARGGLDRCIQFLSLRNRDAAAQGAQVIARQLSLLRNKPHIGRPMPTRPDLRELVIAFGRSGYVALYRHDEAADTVHVLAFRHQREAGY